VGYAVEAGLLDHREAMHHEDRHLISNMVGAPDMRIEVGSLVRIAPRDTLVIASDGLFDNLHLEEIVQLVRRGPLAEVGALLLHTCQQRMAEPMADHPSKPDDLSFILFRRPPRARQRSANHG
jgi:serine/threonine protein phosphatase PrpC